MPCLPLVKVSPILQQSKPERQTRNVERPVTTPLWLLSSLQPSRLPVQLSSSPDHARRFRLIPFHALVLQFSVHSFLQTHLVVCFWLLACQTPLESNPDDDVTASTNLLTLELVSLEVSFSSFQKPKWFRVHQFVKLVVQLVAAGAEIAGPHQEGALVGANRGETVVRRG